ncbi:thiamine-phosphate kinase [Gilvimarinus algae]|uniref:Thiamine-monophosphate kinase n=1 Tax=Gilvimarinus algae TaxID=3058037 RepID=A0ABT8TAP5_9GAMM|nr:thiamine-phosphate kinase [Gilvimarinus sp. SDUM040014]MDO3381182.1 thiamine-phosphate kinase [Gilvimarinus sp. SDUM040014]
MAAGEFELIDHYFKPAPDELAPDSVVLGIGDDGAIVQPDPAQQLVVAADTLVADVHFPADADPELVGERSLRVNLSDLAAMGATPAWFTLSLTLPPQWPEEARRRWVAGFSRGLKACARAYDCSLIGGDTTSGPLTVAIQMLGQVPPGKALRRDGAAVDDFVLVTHRLGDGAAALAALKGEVSFAPEHASYLQQRFYRPEPRLLEGIVLREIASSAQDISDGLLADLGHLCAASDLAAEIDVAQLPLSRALEALPCEQAYHWALTGGDDYELVFTVAPDKMPLLAMAQASGEIDASVIGRIVTGAGVHCELDGKPYRLARAGYRHFE